MRYLKTEEVMFAHDMAIDKDGGSYGIRDLGLLLSALEIPKSEMFGHSLHPTVFDKAAAYMFHIACNHPFIDGNKRTSMTCALLFLTLNDVELDIKYKVLSDFVVDVANGKYTKKEIADFFLKNQN